MPTDSDLLEALLDSSNAILAVIDRDGRIVRVNVGFERVTGYSRGEAVGSPIWSLAPRSEQEHWRRAVLRDFDGEAAERAEWRLNLKPAGERIFSWATWPIRDVEGRVSFRVGAGFDVTEQRQTARRARELAEIVENLGEAVIRTDRDFIIQYANPAAEALYGYRADELVGKPTAALRPPGEHDSLRAFGRLLLETEMPQMVETVRQRKDGSLFPIELRASPLRDERGQVTGFVGITHDISERKKLEAELARQASTDALTGLANRYKFMSVAAAEIVRASRSGRPLALIVADLDHFKEVNDRYGHAVGDAALSRFAERCREELRNVLDLPARLGGEEFAVLLPETHLPSAMLVAERLRRCVAERPIRHGKTEFTLTASFGVSVWIAGEPEITPALERADAALYEAKKQGRNRVAAAG